MSPVTFSLVVLVLIVANQTVSGLFCRYLAYEKNRDGSTWFWLGFLFGPMPIALLTLIGLPVLPASEADRKRLRRLLSNCAALKKISVDEAKVLAQHERGLCLDGLTTLSDEAAKALAQHQGDLNLGGLTTLSDEAAKALAQHKGWVSLNGLTALSDEAAKALRANPDVDLPAKFRR